MHPTRIERERTLLRMIEERDQRIGTLKRRARKYLTYAYIIGCVAGFVCGLIF